MGIYTNGSIFGIRIYNFTDDGFSNTLYEKKYDQIMTHAQMREAYLFYSVLNDQSNIRFQIYTECTSTLEKCNTVNFMDWYPTTHYIFRNFEN